MKSKWKLAFADIIIVICIGVSIILTAAVVWEYHRLDTVMPSGVLAALLGFWGGELLIIAMRQIFGSDAVTRARTTTNTEESTI